jgi:hypothetical protein
MKIIIASLSIIFFLGCVNEKPNLLKYHVLKEWNPHNGIGMELLVDENATKDDIMMLARYLRDKYDNNSFIIIDIFDSEEAWRNRDNQNYSEKEYFKHYLVNMVRNKNTGYDKIKWVAIDRKE